MNEAHLHMIVNHFPIIGTIFGLGIIIFGLFFKNNTIKNTAYSLFIVAALFAFASMATGDGAEDMVKDMPNIGRKIIHEHEEMAEKLAIVLYVLGIISIFGIYTNVKNKAKANLVSYIAATVALVAVLLAMQTGTSGGEIRHTEIRENTGATLPEKVNKAE
ncbi:DUF2231 domain-containing protein [Flavobacterium sp. SUN052]|uniref:DUF2231 domain-containing protein n=1 Tax=Flavobacterium sp. SUN052 TaxID=3002441 RepID=UPI00237D3AD9|nr:DUF2231 domain-containing protein [Flavobacterium sp. SUN052]MEC4005082.1 DUF2231 domain-containing protein [Flavobacterium sp. SUN052]